MGVSAQAEAALVAKFAVMRRLGLDERQWRGYLGSEARALGYGGIAAVARAAGVAPSTVAAGVAEIEAEPALPPGRARRAGGGRKKLEEKEPGLARALRAVLAETTSGEPAPDLEWCSLSLREIGRRLAGLGFDCGKDTIARMMREQGYNLQGMSRVAGRRLPEPDAQFRHINAMIAGFRTARNPVVSVDAEATRLGRIVPCGVYDITADHGFISIGVSTRTAAGAVNALRLWWRREGTARYPGAGRLLVVCGPGGYAGRRWAHELGLLAEQTRLRITVLHSPPGTSKWNKADHRLFRLLTRTWRAPLAMTAEDAAAAIAAAAVGQGLSCTTILDSEQYSQQEVSDERMSYLENSVLDRHDGEWNYTVLPGPPPPLPARAGGDGAGSGRAEPSGADRHEPGARERSGRRP